MDLSKETGRWSWQVLLLFFDEERKRDKNNFFAAFVGHGNRGSCDRNNPVPGSVLPARRKQRRKDVQQTKVTVLIQIKNNIALCQSLHPSNRIDQGIATTICQNLSFALAPNPPMARTYRSVQGGLFGTVFPGSTAHSCGNAQRDRDHASDSHHCHDSLERHTLSVA